MKQNKINFFAYNLNSDTENNKLSGYAVVFDSNSKLMNIYGMDYYTKIDRNAFSEVRDNDIKLLLEHDSKQILAREKNGSLRVFEDEKGLRFEANLGNSMLQKDVVELVSQGIYSQMSFGVLVEDESWETFDDKPAIRTITKGKLLEFSIVSDPAFEQTNLMVASDNDTSAAAFFEKLQKEKEQEVIQNQNKLMEQQAKLLEIQTKL